MARILKYTIIAALGAIIAWAIMEPTPLMPDVEKNIGYGQYFLIGMITGALIGLALGIAEGMSGLSPRDAVKGVLLGTAVGAVGGIIGLTIGASVYGMVYKSAGGANVSSNLPAGVGPRVPKFMSFFMLLIGRGFGWSLIGGFIGLSQGIATTSTKKMTGGAIGGFIGGGLGGIVFEILKWMNMGGVSNFPPAMIRLISFSITGAAIGLFIGSIEELAKQAWLVRLVGHNEGKHYDLYKIRTVIGRSEIADIPVFTDPDVSEMHAAITVQGKMYSIQDLGSSYGTTHNGTKITKEYLHDGDLITIGKTKFVFRDKATATSYSSSSQVNSGVQIPTSTHICPFCGSVKDAAGNCDCSVGASQPAPMQPVAPDPVQQTAMQPQPMGSFTGIDLSALQTPQPGQGARLVGVAGPYAGQVFTLKPGETHIGREDTKDIGMPMDTTVSRNHARIAQEVTSYVLYDSGSTNGTYVSGARIQRHELRPGDILQIGNTKFRFENG